MSDIRATGRSSQMNKINGDRIDFPRDLYVMSFHDVYPFFYLNDDYAFIGPIFLKHFSIKDSD